MRDQSTYSKEQQEPSSANTPTKAGITELTDEQLDWVTGGGKTKPAAPPVYIVITMEDLIIT